MVAPKELEEILWESDFGVQHGCRTTSPLLQSLLSIKQDYKVQLRKHILLFINNKTVYNSL